MFFGTGRLKFPFIYFGILSKVCPQGSPHEGKTLGRGQNDNHVVVTCTVSLSSRSEVSKLQPVGQIQPSDKFYKSSLLEYSHSYTFTNCLCLFLHYNSKVE